MNDYKTDNLFNALNWKSDPGVVCLTPGVN